MSNDRRPDAVVFPASFVASGEIHERVKSVQDAFGPVLGGVVHVSDVSGVAGWFGRLKNDDGSIDSYYFPDKTDRYDWEPVDAFGVRFGYKKGGS